MTTTDYSPLSGIYGAGIPDEVVRDRFISGRWPVAVYGLGKMGLPIASVFADVTGSVVGVDIDETVVDRINRGEATVEGEPGLESLVAEQVKSGALSATVDASAAANAAVVHVVIVPTTLREDRRPDLSSLRTAAHAIGTGITPGDLVLVESTVPPHTCSNVVRPIVATTGGLDVDEFGVAFCPERTSSGRALEDIRRSYPKIVGGVDPESTRLAAGIYDEITDNEVIPVANSTTAECVKLFEGVYRDVNIALANELATFTKELEIDVREAIDVANTQPYCEIHSPGPGVGGHCIPFYPWFLCDGLSAPSLLLRTARYVNDCMPVFTAGTCLGLLAARGGTPDASTVLLLGVAYRPNVAEARKSPAIELAAALADRGATVYAVDPVLDAMPPMEAIPIPLEVVTDVAPDIVIVVTPHAEFDAIDWSAFDDPIVVDCHDALDARDIPHELWTLGST